VEAHKKGRFKNFFKPTFHKTTQMPYTIRKLRNKNRFTVYRMQGSKKIVRAKNTTLNKAKAQVRLLMAYEREKQGV